MKSENDNYETWLLLLLDLEIKHRCLISLIKTSDTKFTISNGDTTYI